MRTKWILSVIMIAWVAIVIIAVFNQNAAAQSKPKAPVGVGAVGATSGCPTGVLHCTNLTWNAPTSGPTPTGYNVYQSTTNGGCSTVTATTCQKVNTSVVATTSFTVSPLSASTTYYNVVTALDAAGESPASNQYTGTTQPDPVPNAPTNLSGVTQ